MIVNKFSKTIFEVFQNNLQNSAMFKLSFDNVLGLLRICPKNENMLRCAEKSRCADLVCRISIFARKNANRWSHFHPLRAKRRNARAQCNQYQKLASILLVSANRPKLNVQGTHNKIRASGSVKESSSILQRGAKNRLSANFLAKAAQLE